MLSRRRGARTTRVNDAHHHPRRSRLYSSIFLMGIMIFLVLAFWNILLVPSLIDNEQSFLSAVVSLSSSAALNDTGTRTNNLTDNNDMKYILYYTPFWSHKDYKFGFGHEPLQTLCPSNTHRNCYATDNRTYLDSMGDFDAVLFHPIDFNYHFEYESIKQWRQPHQRFVYYNVESPATYPPNRNYARGFFNWSMTYRHDSDIVKLYGWFEPVPHYGDIDSYPPSSWKEWPIHYDEQAFLKQDLQPLEHLAKRPKLVAWIVSNCKPAFRRQDYVEELSKYISVDTFGKCGSTPCNVNWASGQTNDNCTQAVVRDYKFYLSFENSLCQDYVTEKFFARVNSSVAIVMGGANYSQVAPPHSFINVMDYASPRVLAEYLLQLDRNDSQYLSYFWWKRYYCVQTNQKFLYAQAFCQLCDKLHDGNEPRKSYASISDWYDTQATCGQIQVPGMPQDAPRVRVDWNQKG